MAGTLGGILADHGKLDPDAPVTRYIPEIEGSVYGGGCTSGHGICGLARLSARSLMAVVVFMGAAAVTVFLSRHISGG